MISSASVEEAVAAAEAALQQAQPAFDYPAGPPEFTRDDVLRWEEHLGRLIDQCHRALDMADALYIQAREPIVEALIDFTSSAGEMRNDQNLRVDRGLAARKVTRRNLGLSCRSVLDADNQRREAEALKQRASDLFFGICALILKAEGSLQCLGVNDWFPPGTRDEEQ